MKQNGYTLVELMIAVTLASMLSLAVVSFFTSQNMTINRLAGQDNTTIESNQSFEVISRLLRYANKQDISIDIGTLNDGISSSPEVDNDRLAITFSLPSQFPIWPNNRPPYDENWVRITWTNETSSTNRYAVLIQNATSKAALAQSTAHTLNDPGSSEEETLIANIDVWPLSRSGQPQASNTSTAEGGYLLRVTSRASQPTPGFENPGFESTDSLLNYRTYTVAGIVAPRN